MVRFLCHSNLEVSLRLRFYIHGLKTTLTYSKNVKSFHKTLSSNGGHVIEFILISTRDGCGQIAGINIRPKPALLYSIGIPATDTKGKKIQIWHRLSPPLYRGSLANWQIIFPTDAFDATCFLQIPSRLYSQVEDWEAELCWSRVVTSEEFSLTWQRFPELHALPTHNTWTTWNPCLRLLIWTLAFLQGHCHDCRNEEDTL